MRAIQYDRHGGPEVLTSVTLPDPSPRADEVVIAVRAAGVNRFDAILRAGPHTMPGLVMPCVPGMDVAGEVVALGADVAGGAVGSAGVASAGVGSVAVGDRVLARPNSECGQCPACRAGRPAACSNTQFLGYSVPGTYAEYVAVRAASLIALPADAGWAAAAALPTVLSTAWRALVHTADLRAGETLLIHGAGSGVTTIAVQVARAMGAFVVVTSRSPELLAKALALGANAAIDTTGDDPAAAIRAATGGRGADVVFDHVGPGRFELSLASIADNGRVVLGGTVTGDQVTVSLPSLYYRGVALMGMRGQSAAQFGEMFERFWRLGVTAAIADELPLDDAAVAHARLEHGGEFGKLVLLP